MEAGWPTIGRKERVALCHLLYAINVLPYDGHDPTKQIVDFFVSFDALEDITPYLVALWIIVIGGDDGRGNTLSSGEVLDLSSKTWSALPPMTTQRKQHSAVRVDNEIIVIGGNDDIAMEDFGGSAQIGVLIERRLDLRFVTHHQKLDIGWICIKKVFKKQLNY